MPDNLPELELIRNVLAQKRRDGNWTRNGQDIHGPMARLLEDAERWRTFIGAMRIRVLGSAGHNDTSGYRHLGLEWWSQYYGVQPEHSDAVRALITRFIDDVRAFNNQKENHEHAGTDHRAEDHGNPRDDGGGAGD